MVPLERLTARDGSLLVVDVQGKLLDKIPERARVLANTVRLIRAAQALGMPYWGTEQYPKGLGPAVPEIAELIPHRPAKTTFHCCSVVELVEGLHGRKIRHVTLAGIEAHVCVAQTALELLRMGFLVQVPADAVASRFDIDWEFALRRLENAGAVLTTTEAVLFEWVESSEHPQFKVISNLIKEFVPPARLPTAAEEKR
ncbi:MAG: hydrolase [Isosphaeraceae bacterium]|nr:hydrolase [Isosphaeraceae bacterium]